MTELPLKQDILRNRDVFFRRMLRIFLLFLALLGGACIGYLLFLVANAHVGNEVRFLYPRLFSDFTQAAYYSVHRDAYLLEGGASYSAIALIFMLPFALIFRKDLLAAEYSAAWAGPNMQILASSWRFWVAFALYQAVVWSVLYLLFRRLTAKSDAGKLLACFASSAGAVYTLIRGNTLLIALVLVLLFLVLNGSERAWKRELGLICFAAAGAFKLYPLFFGAVLLHEKRWGAAARSVLYFLALYFLPVLFYSGGFGAYLGNLFVFIGGENHLADRSNIAIASQLYKLFRFVFSLWGGTVPAWAEGVCIAAGVLFLFFAAAGGDRHGRSASEKRSGALRRDAGAARQLFLRHGVCDSSRGGISEYLRAKERARKQVLYSGFCGAGFLSDLRLQAFRGELCGFVRARRRDHRADVPGRRIRALLPAVFRKGRTGEKTYER